MDFSNLDILDEFDSAAAILIVIITIVFLVEYTSGIVRKQVQ